MGRSLHKLTAIQAAKLTVPGRHSDGGGLYLSIDDSGRRRWVFIYTRGARRTELGLGGGRDLSLANARVEAAAFRTMLVDGLDPKVERAKDDQAQTFGACADAYVEAMRPSWRNEKHAAQWKMTLTKYAAPIRERPVNELTTQDILGVLQPYGRARRKPPSAYVAGWRTCWTPPKRKVCEQARTRLAGAATSTSFYPNARDLRAAIMLRWPTT